MIKGIYHVALRCKDKENYRETLDFYENVIGMKKVRSWGNAYSQAAILSLNGDMMEIFSEGLIADHTGSINHFAFVTDDVDEAVNKVREKGYEVISEPANVTLNLNDQKESLVHLRFAYCAVQLVKSLSFIMNIGRKINGI